MSKNVWYWSLYDFANSILFIVFGFYFPQWLVLERGNPGWWYNATLIAASLLFIAVAPKVSSRVDLKPRKIDGLRFWTAASLAIFAVITLLTLVELVPDSVVAALFSLGMWAYLMCFLYFSPMLNDISTSETRAKISGIGFGFNFLGQVAGLLLSIPFVSGLVTLFGGSPRAEAFLPSVVLMGLLSLPMLLFYKDPAPAPVHNVPFTLRAFVRSLAANRPLLVLLLAYFFFSDALLTFSGNFSLYLEMVYATPDVTKALLSISILALAALGGFLSSFVADRFGHKRMLGIILLLWFALFSAAALIDNFSIMLPLFAIGGVLFGPVWSISRAMVGQLVKHGQAAASFSVYNIAERFATFIGPLTWSGVLVAVGETAQGYQSAIFSMGVLMVVGFAVLMRVPETSAAKE